MKLPIARGDRADVSAEDLTRAARALRSAVETGASQLDPAATERALSVATKVGERMGHAGTSTVVALAGATGSGKSSLFNALVGADVSTIGARRPTTSTPTAAVWGSDSAGDLLDWLDVRTRHQVDAAGAADPALAGLVLLDLPDFDSRETANRVEAERILRLVDVFVWVTDPQKYADARLHDDYVAAMSNYDAVTVVVLNQADRLTPTQLAECRADLERLLHRDGLTRARVLTTSARTGAGVDEVRQELARAVSGSRAARLRLGADLASVTGELRTGVADQEHLIEARDTSELTAALSRAAGVPTVVDAVARDYRRDALAATGWPFTRWVTHLRPDPLRRLRLDKGGAAPGAGMITDSDIRRSVGRSSLPVATPAARAAVDLAARRLGDAASSGLPRRWADAVADAAAPSSDALVDRLDQAVLATPLRGRRPHWWSLVGSLQILVAVAALAGLVWLIVLIGLGMLPALDEPATIDVGPIPLPYLLLAGGLILGWLLALISRWFAGVGARRRSVGVGRRLHESIAKVAHSVLVEPVNDVLRRHAATRAHIDAARI